MMIKNQSHREKLTDNVFVKNSQALIKKKKKIQKGYRYDPEENFSDKGGGSSDTFA